MVNKNKNTDLHRKEIFGQVTKCGEIYVNDDSTAAFVLCSFCKSDSEEQILRSIETFIDHIKWHRSESEEQTAFAFVASEIDNEMSLSICPESDLGELKQDTDELEKTATIYESLDLFSPFPDECLLKIIDLFKKCPCLWHSAVTNAEKEYIEPTRLMITKFFNKLTNRTESVEYITELLEKIKRGFLVSIGETNTSNEQIQALNFLLTSETPSLDESIYTDFYCTICSQKLESREFLWYHLCDCHMETENDDFSSVGFSDESESKYDEKCLNEDMKSYNSKHGEENTEYILEFIKTHKNLPILWDKYHLDFRRKHKRQEAYDILKVVMEKYNQVATNTTVRKQLSWIRGRFVYALSKLEEAKRNDRPYTPNIWYFDKLLYLKHTIRRKKIKSETGTAQMDAICVACNKEFSNTLSCLTHMQRNHDDKAFQSSDGMFYCPVCDRVLLAKSSLIKHMRQAHGPQYNECEECGLKCRSMVEWTKHKAKVHKDFDPFKCPECGKGYGALTRMKLHLVTHWDVNDRPHACDICGSRFSCITNLAVHIRRHTKDYQHECSICSHKVATKTELKSHMSTHLKEYPCICDVCGKAYRNKTTLRMHQDANHENKRYPCDACGKEFRQYKSFQMHYRHNHTQGPGHECQICKKMFTQPAYLRRHMRRKHKIYKHRAALNDAEDCEYIIEKLDDE